MSGVLLERTNCNVAAKCWWLGYTMSRSCDRDLLLTINGSLHVRIGADVLTTFTAYVQSAAGPRDFTTCIVVARASREKPD